MLVGLGANGGSGFLQRGNKLALRDGIAKDYYIFRLARRINCKQRNGTAVELGQLTLDRLIVVGPVGEDRSDAVFLDDLFDSLRVNRGPKVHLTGQAPVGREIDHDCFAFRLKLGNRVG